jgi:hypothetical protein
MTALNAFENWLRKNNASTFKRIANDQVDMIVAIREGI